jgi:hypothetical protein
MRTNKIPGVVAALVTLVRRYIAICSMERLSLGLRGVDRAERGLAATPRRAIGVIGIEGAISDSQYFHSKWSQKYHQKRDKQHTVRCRGRHFSRFTAEKTVDTFQCWGIPR